MQQPLRLSSRYGFFIFLFFLIIHPPSIYAGGADNLSDGIAYYESCGLTGKLNREAFTQAYLKAVVSSKDVSRIVVVDFTLPSTKHRMFIVDLQSKKLLYSGLVAHGKGSGEIMAVNFSNVPERKNNG